MKLDRDPEKLDPIINPPIINDIQSNRWDVVTCLNGIDIFNWKGEIFNIDEFKGRDLPEVCRLEDVYLEYLNCRVHQQLRRSRSRFLIDI